MKYKTGTILIHEHSKQTNDNNIVYKIKNTHSFLYDVELIRNNNIVLTKEFNKDYIENKNIFTPIREQNLNLL